MADGTLSLSNQFEDATEADWLAAVEKALKGGGIDRITRETRDGIKIHPLYRETDFESGSNPRGVPGEAPYLRGATGTPDRYLPWDIRFRSCYFARMRLRHKKIKKMWMPHGNI